MSRARQGNGRVVVRSGELDIREAEAAAREQGISALALDESAAALLERASAAGEALVAVREGDPIAVIAWHRHFFNCPFIALVVVAESARRGGIGRALIDAVERRVDTGNLFTSTNESNAAAQALFERAGFVRSGCIEHLDPGDPGIVYFKRL